jgi:eukaryotic-like serine/threonine-protein kinase
MPGEPSFIETAIKSGLFSFVRLKQLLPNTQFDDPDAMMAELRKVGELTQFQSEKLSNGYWQGLKLDQYRVLEPIGRGGMGLVYLCAIGNSNLGEKVALKIVPPRVVREEPRRLERFHREIKLGKLIPKHPNIATSIEGDEISGLHYLVMEYVEGPTLRKRVQDTGPLPSDEAIGYAIGMAEGLDNMHSANIIHRDFKPANVILHPTGRAKILDFGFALQLGETLPEDPRIVGGQGYVIGTMDYIAPEQIKNATQVKPVSDLYALGCTLFYSLTGTPPYPGGDTQMKLKWHQTSDVPDVRAINSNVHSQLAFVVKRLLNKDPDKRPKSGSEVVKHLKSIGRPIVVTVMPSE